MNSGPDPLVNTPATRKQRYQLYEQQALCVSSQVKQLIATLRHAGIYKRAIIIVHGDHSARIPVNAPTLANQQNATQRDYLDMYPMLFAIKAPEFTPGLDNQVVSLDSLLATIAGILTGQSISDPAPKTPFIYFTLENDIPGQKIYRNNIDIFKPN